MDLKQSTAGTEGKIQVLAITGRFDAYEVAPIKKWLDEHTAQAPAQLIINLEGVNFIDSQGLASLVQGMKHARQKNGELVLCGLQQAVRIIFELTRLDRAFEIVPTQADAVALLTAAAQ